MSDAKTRPVSLLIISALALGLLTVALGACARPAPIGLKVGHFPTLDSLPFFVLMEKGFDRQEGLAVSEKIYPGAAVLIDAIATGEVDAGAPATVPILTAGKSGMLNTKITVIAANCFSDPEHPTGAVFVGGAIKSWKDLEGGRIAVNSTKSLGAWALQTRLRMEGVRRYSMVVLSFEDMGLAISQGVADAAVLAEPFVSQSLLRGDGKVLGWVVGGAPLESIEFSDLVVSTSLLKQRPEAARALLRAWIRSVRWILDHEAEARAIIARRLSIDPELAKSMTLPRWTRDCRNDSELLASMQRTLVAQGFEDRSVPVAELYDDSLLEASLKSLR